ncbi:MAG: S1C family serine protease [Spirochaetia bacterium]
MKRFIIGSVLIITLFTACNTFEETPAHIVSLKKVLIADVKKLIDQESYLEAVQYLSRLQRESTEVSKDELADLQKEARDGIIKKFRQAVENKDFSLALCFFLSLKSISALDEVKDWNENELRLKLAETSLKNGNEQLALLEYMQVLHNPSLEAKGYKRLLALAAGNNNIAAIRRIISVMRAGDYPVPRKYIDLTKQATPISTMVEGTVTIWVNRGVKLDKGVGRPNIVLGSGFFVDKRGYIMTNYHVIASEVDPEYEGYSRCYIILSDNRDQKIPAKVVAYDKLLDLALLKAEITPKYVFSTIDDNTISTGQKITVIGSPVGLENTVTAGIVSSTARRIMQVGSAIQIDAPVNFGNSGGPVISEDGNLIGVVFAGLEEFEGLNFALPAKWINKMLGRLFGGEQAVHMWAGIALKETQNGLEVIYVMPGDPAFQAGIRTGDIIDKVNDREYTNIVDIQSLFLSYEHPALISFSVKRNEHLITIPVCLEKRPFIPLETALDRDIKVNLLYPLFGMKLEKVGTYLWETHYQVERVLEGSAAEEIGLSQLDSVYIRGWAFDPKNKIVQVQILAKRRKKGFLEAIVYLPAFLKTNYFI